MAAEAGVCEDVSVREVDENSQVHVVSGSDLPEVDGDCNGAALEAVSDHSGEAESDKNGNSIEEDDPDGSYVFISHSNSVNGACVEKTLLEGDHVSVDGSLNNDKEVQVQKLSADNGDAASQENGHHEANESPFLSDVESVVLEASPVSDGCTTVLANGVQEDHNGVDHKPIQLVSASQGDEESPNSILSVGDPQLYNGVSKLRIVDQDSIQESDETSLSYKLRESPESGIVGSDVGDSHVKESGETNGVSLGSTEGSPPLIDDVKIQHEEENKTGTETESAECTPSLIDDVKIQHEEENKTGSETDTAECTPSLIDDVKIQHEEEEENKTGSETETAECTPSLIDDVKIQHEEENITGSESETAECTPPLIDDVKIQHEVENKTVYEIETEKIHVAPSIDGIKINVYLEEHGGLEHEPVQLDPACEEDQQSILILNAGDPHTNNDVAKTGLTTLEPTPELDVICLATKLGEATESGDLDSGVGIMNEATINLQSTCHVQESEEIHVMSLRSTEYTPPLIDDIKIQFEVEGKIGSDTVTEKIYPTPLIDDIKPNGNLEEHIGEDHEPIQLKLDSEDSVESPISISNTGDPLLDNGVDKIEVTDQESSPYIDETSLVSKVQVAHESEVIGSDMDSINDIKTDSDSCNRLDSENIEEGASLGSTECTPPLIDDKKTQFEKESKICSEAEAEAEKIHITSLIDNIKVNGDQEEHIEVDHEPIQSKMNGKSPDLISNSVDAQIHSGVNKIGLTNDMKINGAPEEQVDHKPIQSEDNGSSPILILNALAKLPNGADEVNVTDQGSSPDLSECTPPGIDDIKIQYDDEETKISSYAEIVQIHAAPLIDEVNPIKEVIIESQRKIETSKDSKSVELEANGSKQPQVEDENKEEPPLLMKQTLTSEIRTPQSSNEASQLEHGEENFEEPEKIEGGQNVQESGMEIDLSKEVAKVTNEAGVSVVEGTSGDSSKEDINILLSNNEICNLGVEAPNPALSSSNVEIEAGKLNGVNAPLSPVLDSLKLEDGSNLKLKYEIEKSSSSNDAHVYKLKDADTYAKKAAARDGHTYAKKSAVQDGDVNNGVKTANRGVTLPITTEGSKSKSNASEEQNIGFGFVKKPFYYLIKMPRYENAELRKQIEHAQREVFEKTKNRDTTKSEIKDGKTKSLELQAIFESAKSEERSTRGLVKSKRQEIDTVQAIISKVKNAMTVDDIDIRVRGMEHMIQHETVPLKEEKQYIREIKQLKHLREQLCSGMGTQEDVQQALNQRDEAEERLKVLKKELDRLKETALKAEEAARDAWKKLDESRNKIRELYTLFTSEDDVRQDAFKQLQNLKKQMRDKSTSFRRYKDEEDLANGYAASGDKEVLNLFCINQVSRAMEQWNKDEEFRKEYIKCNERSTLRRFGTLDGRALSPDEESPILPKTHDRRTVPSTVAPPVTKKLPVIESAETTGKPAETKVVVQIKQKLRTETPPTNPSSDKIPAPKEEKKPEKPKEEQKPEKPKEEKKPEKTKEEIEMELRKGEEKRKEEERRKEEEMTKMKEQQKMEEKAKEKEALDRKKRNAEKANARAELRAQKEAEQKEKNREKKLRKKERKQAMGKEEEVSKGPKTSQPVTINKEPEKEAEMTKESTNNLPLTKPVPPMKPASIQFGKQIKSQLIPPPALRNKGRKRTQQWIWAIGITLLVIALFLLGNFEIYSTLKGRIPGL